MLHLGDNGSQKPPLLTPFLTPVAPRRARDRVLSILALGPFLAVSDFTQPKTAPLPSPPLSIYWLSPNRKLQSKMAPLRFCTSGSEMPLTEEPGLYQRPCPRSPSHSVSTTNTLSGALCLRPLPSASRTGSRDCYHPHHPRPSHLLAVLPLPSSPAAVAGRCVARQPRTVGAVRYFRFTTP
jgi:hypothetical protein